MKIKNKRKENSANRKGLTFLLALLCVLTLLSAVAGAVYLRMERRGMASFAEKQEAVPEQMQREEEASVSVNEARTAQDNVIGEGLEAGRISYQGRIYAYKSDVLTFLCMGIDRKGEVKASANPFKGGQADALFLVVLDPKDKRSSVIGINRDTMTEISTFDRNGLYAGKETAQLALAHAYGDGLEKSCENTVEAVSKLFYGLPVHGYCALNMSAISLLNDAVGGVDVVIPESGAGIMKDWKTGEQVHLDGKHAYTFIQYRDMALPRSAQARLERQKLYLDAFIRQAKTAMKKDMTLPVKLYAQIAPYMVTDISADEAVYLAGEALGYRFGAQDIYTLQGHVEMGEKFEEFYQDDEALYELILQVFYEQLEDGRD